MPGVTGYPSLDNSSPMDGPAQILAQSDHWDGLAAISYATAANFPAAGATFEGRLAYARDTGILYIVKNSAWASVYAASTSATPSVGSGWNTPNVNQLVRVGGQVWCYFNAFRASASSAGATIITVPNDYLSSVPNDVWGLAWGLAGAAAAMQVYYNHANKQVRMNQGLAASQSVAFTLSWPA